jgi:hypothetical protein
LVERFRARSDDVAAALAMGIERGLIQRRLIPGGKRRLYVYGYGDQDLQGNPGVHWHATASEAEERRAEGDRLLAMRRRGESVPMARLALATDLSEPQVENITAMLKEGYTLTACCASLDVTSRAVRLIAGCIGWTYAWRKPSHLLAVLMESQTVTR